MGKEQATGNENQPAFWARPANPPAVQAPNEVTVFQASAHAAEIPTSPALVDTFVPNKRQQELLANFAPGDSFTSRELRTQWGINRSSVPRHIRPLKIRGLVTPKRTANTVRYQRTDVALPGRPLTQEELAAEHAARKKHNEYSRSRLRTERVREMKRRQIKKWRDRKLHDLSYLLNDRQITIRDGLGVGSLITTRQYVEKFHIAYQTALQDIQAMANQGLLARIRKGPEIIYIRIDPTRSAAENEAFVASQASALNRKPKTEQEKIMEEREALVRNAYASGDNIVLTPREDFVLTARYRNEGTRPTFEQLTKTLAQAFGRENVTKGRVHQLEARGLKKLKEFETDN